jgi:hypothetical protein
MQRVAFAAALIVAASTVSVGHAQQAKGEVYEWTDARGVTHYSGTPPASGTFRQRVITHAGSAAPAPGQAATPVAAVDDRQCRIARANIAALASERPVGPDADGDGKPDSPMTTEQRAAQRNLAEAAVKAYCSP